MGFVLFRSFSNYVEASIAVSVLEQEGINCHLVDENTVTIMNMASGIRLMVFESQVTRAAEILENIELEYLKSLQCPSCAQKGFSVKYIKEEHGSTLQKLPFGRIISFLAKNLSKEGTTIDVKHYVCSACHKEFDTIPSSG